MGTAPSIYELLATVTAAFRILSGVQMLNGTYRFTSLTLTM
jgi:hypothetical protein